MLTYSRSLSWARNLGQIPSLHALIEQCSSSSYHLSQNLIISIFEELLSLSPSPLNSMRTEPMSPFAHPWISAFYIILRNCLKSVFPGGSEEKNPPAVEETQVPSVCWEDPLEKGMTNHSSFCLDNSMDRRAWQATVHGVTNCQTQVSHQHTHTHTHTHTQ